MANVNAIASHNENLAMRIRRDIYKRNLSLAKAAVQIDVPPATLRTWIDRNRFPKYALERLIKFLGWHVTPDQLADEYHLDKTAWEKDRRIADDEIEEKLLQAFEAMDQAGRLKLPQLQEDNVEGICRCFRAMRQGDLFVFSSLSVTPFEFVKHKFGPIGPAVAEAVKKGAACLYLLPNEDALKGYLKDWDFHQMVPHAEFVDDFNSFKANVEAYLLQKYDGDMNPDDTRNLVSAKIILHEYGTSPFMAPGFAIGMFQTSKAKGEVVRRMTVRVPSDYGGVLYLPHKDDDLLTWRFVKFVEQTLADIDHLTPDHRNALAKVHELIQMEYLAR